MASTSLHDQITAIMKKYDSLQSLQAQKKSPTLQAEYTNQQKMDAEAPARLAEWNAQWGKAATTPAAIAPVPKLTVPSATKVTIRAPTSADRAIKIPFVNYENTSGGVSDLAPIGDILKHIGSGVSSALSGPATFIRSLPAQITGKLGSVSNPGSSGYYSALQAVSDLTGHNVDKKISSVPVVGNALDAIANFAADTVTDPTTYLFGSGLSGAKGVSTLDRGVDLDKALNTAKTVKQAQKLTASSGALRPIVAIPEAAKLATPIVENGKLFSTAADRDANNVLKVVKNEVRTAPIASARKIIAGAEKATPTAATAADTAKNVDTASRIVSGTNTLGGKIKAATAKTAGAPKGALSRAYQRLADVNAPFKQFDKVAGVEKASDSAYIASSNASNSGGISNFILREGLVDTKGNIVGESLKKVAGDIPKSEQSEFEDYLLHKLNIERMANDQPVFGKDVTSEMSKAKVKEYETKFPEFKKASAELKKFWNTFADEWRVKTGLTSADAEKAMREKHPDYVPTYRQFLDTERVSGVKGAPSHFVNQPNMIKKATGSSRPIINPLESMTQLIQRTVKAAKYNEVGQKIYAALKADPETLKPFAQILPDDEIPKVSDALKSGNLEDSVDELLQQWQQTLKDKTRQNIVRVMVDGKPQYIQINDSSLLRSLTGMAMKPSEIESGLRKVSNVIKGTITTYNPMFGAANAARDFPTYLVNSVENNPAKSIGSLIGSYKDMITKAPTYQKYRALGGGGGGLFRQSYESLSKKGILEKLNALNDAIEQAPRYAEFKNTLRKLGTDESALKQGIYNANEVTTNFSRHGDITKAADAGVLYLNAGVQGLDKVARQVIQHPVGTLTKGFLAVTLPTAALDAVNWNNPNYQALDNRTKDNYFNIPNYAAGTDENGYAKTFIKIPKAREYGTMFGSLVERIIREAAGQKNAFQDFGNTVYNNLSPGSLNLLGVSTASELNANKAWNGSTIVPTSMKNLSPKYQYDDTTTEIAKAIGSKTNLSPKQIDYVVSQLTGVIGQFVQPLATKSTYSNGNPLSVIVSPATKRFTSNPLYNNQEIEDFYNNYDTAKRNVADQKFTGQNADNAKDIYSYIQQAQSKMQDITKQINALNPTKDAAQIAALRQQMIQTATDANNYMSGNRSESQNILHQAKQYSNYLKSIAPESTSSTDTSDYTPLVKQYMSLSKAHRKDFYDQLSYQDQLELIGELSQSGVDFDDSVTKKTRKKK